MKALKRRRIMSVVMSFLMAVSMIPMDFTGIVANAATTEGVKTTWDAADILAATTQDSGLTICGDGWSKNTASDTKEFEDGTTAVGDNAKAGSAKAKTDGVNATGTIPTEGCYIKYTASADGKLTIYTKIGKGKTFYIVPSDGTAATAKTNDTDASTYDMVTADVTAGVTYYAYLSGATAQVWKVAFAQTKQATEGAWDASQILAATTADRGLTINDTWSENDATDDKTFEDNTSAKGLNAKATGNKAKTAGTTSAGQVPDSGCYIKYTATEDGTLSVYEKTGKGKTFYIVCEDGTVAGKYENDTDASTYDIVTASVKEGKSYYAYLGGATAQVWKVAFKGGAVEEVKTPWDQVQAPVINQVTVNEDGDFDVDFTAVIDKLKGAEDVKITMLENGYECSTQTVKAQKDSVTFTPGWSGNYTFVAVAQRQGEADKASETYKYDNYVISVKKPVIELAKNEGNGKLYVDWINIDDADSFDVEYKLSSAENYTMAQEGNTTGNYTFDNLAVGKTYDVKITAVRKSDNYKSVYTKSNIEITQDEEQQWYAATVGSAQSSDVTISNADGSVADHVEMSSKDEASTKTNNKAMVTAANTDKTVSIAGSESGKISDGEEGFTYYYTMMNPNTDNFDLKATFKITDTSLTPDNQTGFGLMATDMLGINYYGSADYVHKYFNQVTNQFYSAKSKFGGMRNITGYFSNDTTSFDGVTRTTDERKYQNTAFDFAVGNTYTFELKKTDNAYIASCNGEEFSLDDTSVLSVQEDGSICVGVMASRKVSVDISDISLTKSDSNGVGSGKVVDDTITPSATIYSSTTSGSKDYEFIYQPNVAGQLVVTAPDGSEAYNKVVAANEVVKVNVPLTTGDNEIKATLVPDKTQKLTSYGAFTKTITVTCQQYGLEGQTIIVAPDASSDGKGTMESPLDIYTAVKYAQPGQVLYLKNGSYTGGDVKIERSVSGTADKNITMVAETTGQVKFDGVGLNVTGSYWHIYGIHVYYPSNVGIQICGNYNTIEMCTVEGSKNTGIQISRNGSADNVAGIESLLWPSYNLVKNCESFDNCDAGRNDADGFAAKLTCGEGNQFYGCISHNNIDDGWDLFAKTISGEIGSVLIENCVAYNNGWLTTDDTTAAGYVYGEGNGFKLGGSYMKGGHVLKNSITFNNGAKGITSNSCPDCEVYNATSYNNSIAKAGSYNVGLNTKDSNVKEWKVSGLISMADPANTTKEDLIPFSLASGSNYIYNGTDSYNNQGVKADAAWFVNTDTTNATTKVTRNENGTINMHGLLELNASAPTDAGARLDTTSEKAISVQPVMTTIVGSSAGKDPVGPTDPTDPTNPTNPTNPTDPVNPTGSQDASQGTGDGSSITNGTDSNAQSQTNATDVQSNTDNTSDSSVATGDRTNVNLYIIIFVAAGLIIGGVCFYNKKKNRSTK